MLWTGFLFGFLGGFHCVGMCGPIALVLPSSSSKFHFIFGRIAYNLGRTFTYSLLGLLFGLFGRGLHLAGLQQGVSILSGVMILFFIVFPVKTTSKLSTILGLGYWVHQLKKTLSAFLAKRSISGLTTIGILNGLLPCGFVYLALAATISFDTLHESVLYMFFFGLGTIPLMLLLVFSGQLIGIKFRNAVQKVVPYAFGIIGILFIIRGMALDIPYLSPYLIESVTDITSCH